MIEILICDDDKHFCGDMEKIIMGWASERQYRIHIEHCYSGKALRQILEKREHPDLLLLDIELGDETGVRIGDYIRDYLKDENLQIIFISSQTQYAMELFRIRPFDFLIKPVSIAMVSQVLDKYYKVELCTEKKYFLYQQKQNTHRIQMEDIIYFQSDRKKIRIFVNRLPHNRVEACEGQAQGNIIEYYGNLEDVMRQLDDRQFWNIHKSYIVHVKYVKTFRRNVFVLLNDEEIPVSRSRWKDVQQWILKHEEA